VLNYEKILSIGTLEERLNLDELNTRVKNINIEKDEVIQLDELILARIDNYYVFAVLEKQEKLKTEKMYLLKLFIQNAAQAIRNAELYEKLLQKEKLSAVGQVIGMVMHDLRSPIKNIKLITQMMRDEGDNNEMIDMIDQSAEQASEIFDDFLDFIKEIPVEKKPVSLNKIIEETTGQINASHKKAHIAVVVNICDNMVVPGDESKLRRALTNLINNATDILHDKGIENPVITISCEIIDSKLQLTVSDNGPGIPQEIMTTLFEPFITKNKSNGTGLGLAIVKQYINAHGGEISVSNNGGAVFKIVLPL
jgi:signal transduction histidine kinase